MTFGQNSYGELIQGDTATRKSPARVMAVRKNIVAVCAGNEHTVLMTGDGLHIRLVTMIMVMWPRKYR